MFSSVTVVGAGIFGTCTALELLDRGHAVRLLEQFSNDDSRTTSNGISRNIRFSHGNNVWYTKSAWQSRFLWKELENRLSTKLMDECGVAWFSQDEVGWASASQLTLEKESIPVERLDPSDGDKLYPSFGYHDLSFILFEPNAGVLRSNKAITFLRNEFVNSGGALLRGKV